jgi:hypothetical protein
MAEHSGGAMKIHLVLSAASLAVICASGGIGALANPAGNANGACLMALERSKAVNKARHAPGSSADFTEIISTRGAKGGIEVRWRTNVFYGSKIKPVLNGSCFVSADGQRVRSVRYK